MNKVKGWNDNKLAHEIDEAEVKAIKALAGYKFAMFGYWAGIWVHLNKIEGKKRPSPFKALVHTAREYPVAQGGRVENTQDRDEPAMIPELAPSTVTRIVDLAIEQVRQTGRASIELYEVGSPNDYTVCWALVIDSGVIKIWSPSRIGAPVDREEVEAAMARDVNHEDYGYRVGGGL